MKKTLSIFICIIFAISMFSLTACDKLESFESQNAESASGYIAVGGEGDFQYERAYEPKLYSLDESLLDFISKNSDVNLDSWLQEVAKETKSLKFGISSPEKIPSLILAIEEFDISKSDFEKINANNIAVYEKNGDYSIIEQVCFTQEEIDALYSNNDEKLINAFASEYAIISNGKAYAPNFYLNASTTELSAYGITNTAVAEKTDVLLNAGIIEKNAVK